MKDHERLFQWREGEMVAYLTPSHCNTYTTTNLTNKTNKF